VDFIAQTFERQGKLKTPEGQAQTVRSIVRTISRMKDELKRTFYIKRVAEKYRLYESTLYRELEKLMPAARRPDSPALTPEQPPQLRAIVDVPMAELTLIRAMVEGGADTIRFVFSRIELDEFTHPRCGSSPRSFSGTARPA